MLTTFALVVITVVAYVFVSKLAITIPVFVDAVPYLYYAMLASIALFVLSMVIFIIKKIKN